MIGIIGDIHSHFKELFNVIEKHPQVDAWLQVGDLGGEEKPYPDFPVPFYFISGNHENWDKIENIDEGTGPKNLIHIKNGDTEDILDLKILGFGGNYSPKYSKSIEKLQGDRRRHNTRFEVIKASTKSDIDIFICHEPPQPYIVKDSDCGIANINKILVSVKPKICFFGHHHYFSEEEREGVNCIGLEYGWKSFVLLDPDDMMYEIVKL